MTLIDADEYIKELCRTCPYETCNKEIECYEVRIARGMPIVDAVPVVRCKDCKWFEPEDEDGDCWCYCDNDITCRDGYCSWGERKEDENA